MQPRSARAVVANCEAVRIASAEQVQRSVMSAIRNDQRSSTAVLVCTMEARRGEFVTLLGGRLRWRLCRPRRLGLGTGLAP